MNSSPKIRRLDSLRQTCSLLHASIKEALVSNRQDERRERKREYRRSRRSRQPPGQSNKRDTSVSSGVRSHPAKNLSTPLPDRKHVIVEKIIHQHRKQEAERCLSRGMSMPDIVAVEAALLHPRQSSSDSGENHSRPPHLSNPSDSLQVSFETAISRALRSGEHSLAEKMSEEYLSQQLARESRSIGQQLEWLNQSSTSRLSKSREISIFGNLRSKGKREKGQGKIH